MPTDLEFDYEATTAALKFYSETDIKELQQWSQKLDKSTYVPKNLSNKQLVLFYNACRGKMENSKICIEKYYIYRRNAPEFFNHRLLKLEELKTISEICEIYPLPEKSADGSNVLCYRLHDNDTSKFSLDATCKLCFMSVDLCLFKSGPQRSYLGIVDASGLSFGHLTKLNPSTLLKIFQYIQEAMLICVRGIHIINAEPIIDKLLTILKPFMMKRFYDTIKIYKKGESLEELYKVFPKSSLPSDYGGTQPDIQTLFKENLELLKSLETYFKDEEEQRHAALPDETGRNTLEGTFKKLDID